MIRVATYIHQIATAVDMIEDFKIGRIHQKRFIRELPTALEMRLTLDKCGKEHSFSAI